MATELPPSTNPPARPGHPLTVVRVEFSLKENSHDVAWKSAKWSVDGNFPWTGVNGVEDPTGLDSQCRDLFKQAVKSIRSLGYARAVAGNAGRVLIATGEPCGGYWNYYCNRFYQKPHSHKFVAEFTNMGVTGGDFSKQPRRDSKQPRRDRERRPAREGRA